MQETKEMQVESLGREDPLEKEMANPLQNCCQKILWTGEPGRLQSIGLQKAKYDRATKHTFKSIDHFY